MFRIYILADCIRIGGGIYFSLLRSSVEVTSASVICTNASYLYFVTSSSYSYNGRIHVFSFLCPLLSTALHGRPLISGSKCAYVTIYSRSKHYQSDDNMYCCISSNTRRADCLRTRKRNERRGRNN